MIRKSKSDYKATVTIYECESCLECPYKNKCTKAKGNKQLQVEGAFGVIKQDYGFRRFLTPGKVNVKTELSLMTFGYK